MVSRPPPARWGWKGGGWSWPQLPTCYSSVPTSTHSPSTHGDPCARTLKVLPAAPSPQR